MVVVDVFREQPLQMAFVDGDDVIQQVPSATLNPSLRNAILPRTFQRCSDGTDSQRSNRGKDVEAVLAIAIEDQESRSRPIGEGLPQLLNHPTAGRMACHVAVQDAAAVVADDEEAVQHVEGHRGDREEVHRCDGFSMVTQKCKPSFGWFRVPRRSLHPTGDRPL